MKYPGRFETVPQPLVDNYNAFGVHPVVCCPKYIPDTAICFESDPWCVNYVQREYEYEEYPQEAGDYPQEAGAQYDAQYDGDYTQEEPKKVR